MLRYRYMHNTIKQVFHPVTNQRGFTFLMLMFFIVLIGISLMAIGQQWSVIMKRDREAELLFRGNRIKEAIERFVADYEVQKATRPNRFPQKLEDLTKKPKRYLPVVYKDPMTGEDFDLIKTGTEIRGVRSTSEEKPFDEVHFKGAKSYQDIRFETTGTSADCTPNPLNPLLPSHCQQTGTSPTGKSPDGQEKPTSPSPTAPTTETTGTQSP